VALQEGDIHSTGGGAGENEAQGIIEVPESPTLVPSSTYTTTPQT
jgi:urease alpha subunit